MITVAGLLIAAWLLLALIVTEPARAERRQQAEADEAALERDYWRQVRA